MTNNIKNVCFTGHRSISSAYILRQELLTLLESLMKNGAVHFYTGGALGWDTLCADTVLYLKDEYPDITLNLLLPCPANEQTSRWRQKDRDEFKRIMTLADTVEVCSPRYTQSCMKIRNQRLIDAADCCICYYDAEKSISGTGQTVRMARSKGIEIINLCRR